MGELEGFFFYQMDGSSELMDPEGLENNEVPMDSPSIFMCNITGTYRYENWSWFL